MNNSQLGCGFAVILILIIVLIAVTVVVWGMKH